MKQFLVISGAGYMISVLVAVTVTEILYFAPSIFPDQGRYGSFFQMWNDITGIFFVGIFYTATTAFPGYCMTLWIAWLNRWHSWQFYCIGGVLTALLAHVLLAALMGGANLQPYLVFFCSVPGGAAGAFSYFTWRKNILSALNP